MRALATSGALHHRLARFVVAAAMALSLVLVAASRHSASVVLTGSSTDYAQFLAAGGSADDLCRDSDAPNPGPAVCDKCRLSHIALSPDAIGAPAAPETGALRDAPARRGRPAFAAFSNPAAPQTGPPAIV